MKFVKSNHGLLPSDLRLSIGSQVMAGNTGSCSPKNLRHFIFEYWYASDKKYHSGDAIRNCFQ